MSMHVLKGKSYNRLKFFTRKKLYQNMIDTGKQTPNL